MTENTCVDALAGFVSEHPIAAGLLVAGGLAIALAPIMPLVRGYLQKRRRPPDR